MASRFLGLIRNTVFAAEFGTGPDIKAYFAAFRVPDLLYTLISGGALASAFIPVFAGLLEQRKESEAWSVANTVLNTLFIAMTGLALLAFILAPQITDHLVVGFTPSQKAETADLTRIMLVQPVLLGVAGMFTAVQQSYGRFLLPAIGPIVYNLSIILGTLVFGPRYGVYAAAWAVTIGALLLFQIQLPGIVNEAARYRVEIMWRLSAAREVLRLVAPRVVGLGAYQVMLLVTTYLASRLSNDAFNAIIYSWVLVMLPVNTFGSSVGTAVFPQISRQSAVSQIESMRDTMRNSVRIILFLSIPSTVGLIVLRRPIVDLLYHHGRWTLHSTETTAFALAFYTLGLVPMALIELMPRAFYALRDTRTPVTIAVVALLLDAVLSVILIHVFPRGERQGGLALATAISVWLQVLWLARVLGRRLPGLFDPSLMRGIVAMSAGAILMGGLVYLTLRLLDQITSTTRFSGALIEVVATVAIGAGVYLGIARLFGLPEVARLRSLLQRGS